MRLSVFAFSNAFSAVRVVSISPTRSFSFQSFGPSSGSGPVNCRTRMLFFFTDGPIVSAAMIKMNTTSAIKLRKDARINFRSFFNISPPEE